MNGIGKLDRGDIRVLGLFNNDRFVRLVESNEIGELRHYLG
jgi:hypothetical protein